MSICDEFETPREASLKAENARLRAENSYLKEAVEGYGLKITPFETIDEISVQSLPCDEIRLPLQASIVGQLMRGNRYGVIAKLHYPVAENLQINYYAPAWEVIPKWRLNELFPYLHTRFIAALAATMFKTISR